LDMDLLETIDRVRGDVPRSRYIQRLIEKALKEKEVGAPSWSPDSQQEPYPDQEASPIR